MINRYDLLKLTVGAAGDNSGGLLAACGAVGERHGGRQEVGSASGRGRLLVRPGPSPPAFVRWGLAPDATASSTSRLDRLAVDAERVAAGFCDGASYALSLGLTNGELFTHLIAFSPGFMVPVTKRGKPPVFVSHGTRDGVLPIERCSRRIVPQLDREGYRVRYREFDGPRTVPR